MPFELDELIAQAEKAFGPGTLVPATAVRPKQYRGTGSLALDIAAGGGWAKGTVVDVIGKQSAGKTLLFEMAAVEAQKRYNEASALFDFEGTFDPRRFRALGGDTDGLLLIRAENFGIDVGPLFLDWAADMLKMQLQSKKLAHIGMDSTAAMVTKAEFMIKEAKGEEQATVASTARGMSSLLRQIVGTGTLLRSESTVFFMSQMRDNIGGRGLRGMKPADNRTGGRALPFYAANQVEVSRGEVFTASVQDDRGNIEKDTEVGHETRIRIRKNKNNAKQGRVCTFDVYSEGDVVGIDRTAELAKLAVLTGVIQKAGSWYTNAWENLRVQGQDALQSWLTENTVPAERIEIATRAALDIAQSATALPEEVIVGEDPDFKDDLINVTPEHDNADE